MLINLTMALPIAVMLASIMTFGNMGEHFELTAAKSAGIALYKIMSPIFFLAIIFTLTSYIFANNIFPYASIKVYSLVSSIRQQHPALRLQEGIFNYDVEGYVIKIGEKSKNSTMMYDFMIYDHITNEGNKSIILADSGTVMLTSNLKYMIITMYSGSQYSELKENNEEEKTYPYHIDEFDKQVFTVPLKGFDYKETDQAIYTQHYNMLNNRQINEKIDSLKEQFKQKIDYYYTISMHSDVLTNQIKLRTDVDSINYLQDIKKLNNIKGENLTVILNTDSIFNTYKIIKQKEIIKSTIALAEKSYNRLNVFFNEYEAREIWITEHIIAKNRKYVYALACFIFFFIGAPLGTIIRKGGFGLPTIISVLLILVFYILLTLGEKFAKDGTISGFNGMWLPIYIFVPFEIFLFYKASTDSVVLNYDQYINFFVKIFKKITPKFLQKRKYKVLRQKALKRIEKRNKKK